MFWRGTISCRSKSLSLIPLGRKAGWHLLFMTVIIKIIIPSSFCFVTLNLTLNHLVLFPLQRVKTPELVPEDAEPFWSRGQQGIVSKSMGAKQKIQSIIIRTHDYLGDPRIGPALLLGALMSFGGIWLIRSQQNHPVQSSQPSQADDNVGDDSECFSLLSSNKLPLKINYIDH